MADFSAEELAAASDGDLRELLAIRDDMIVKAIREIEDLELAPRFFAERLARLEQYFADLRPGDTLRLVDPQLKAETEALKEKLGVGPRRDYMDRPHLDHEEDHAVGSWFAAGGSVAAHAEHEDFVLGKGYMHLDQNALHYRRAHNARVQNYHPTVDAVHYAGNLDRAPEHAHALFKSPGCRAEHRSVDVPDPRSTFWLERPWAPEPRPDRHDPPLFGQPASTTAPSGLPESGQERHEHHQEPLAVDWLGLARRGVPADGLGEAP